MGLAAGLLHRLMSPKMFARRVPTVCQCSMLMGVGAPRGLDTGLAMTLICKLGDDVTLRASSSPKSCPRTRGVLTDAKETFLAVAAENSCTVRARQRPPGVGGFLMSAKGSPGSPTKQSDSLPSRDGRGIVAKLVAAGGAVWARAKGVGGGGANGMAITAGDPLFIIAAVGNCGWGA